MAEKILMFQLTERMKYWNSIWNHVNDYRDNTSCYKQHYNSQMMLMELHYYLDAGIKLQGSFLGYIKLVLNYIKSNGYIDCKAQETANTILSTIHQKDYSTIYLEILVKELLDYFVSGSSFRFLQRKLASLLIPDSPIDEAFKKNIDEVSPLLCIEYLNRGYTDEEVADMPKTIFAELFISDESFYTEFPLELQYDMKTVNMDNIEQLFSRLSLSKRIRTLILIYYKKEAEYRYIMPLIGVRIDNSNEISYPNAVIYNAENRKMIDINDGKDNQGLTDDCEVFERSDTDRKINILVSCSAISPSSGYEKAKRIASDVFNVLVLKKRFSCKHGVQIGKYIFECNEYRQLIRGSSNERRSLLNAINLSNVKEGEFHKQLLEYVSNPAYPFSTRQRVNTILAYLREATDAETPEMKLLYAWNVIEYALLSGCPELKVMPSKGTDSKSVTKIVDLIIPALHQREHFLTARYLYREIQHQLDENPDYYGYSKETKDYYAKGKMYGENSITELLMRIDDIEKEIHDWNDVNLHIEQCKKVYGTGQKGKKYLSQLHKRYENEIKVIYAYRNMIVHDGYCGSVSCTHYSAIALLYAQAIVSRYLGKLVEEKLNSLEEAIYCHRIGFEKYKKSLDAASEKYRIAHKYAINYAK